MNVKERWVGDVRKVGGIIVNLDPSDPTGQTAGDDISGESIEFAVRSIDSTASRTWLAAGWVGTVTNEGYAETTADYTFATKGKYVLFARVGGEVILSVLIFEVKE